MTRIIVGLSTALVALGTAAVSMQARGIDGWTEAQKEVWATVERYCAAERERDLERYLSFFHPDFVGWHDGDKGPTNKEVRARGLAWYFANFTPITHSLEPLAVVTRGEIAVVHYRIHAVLKGPDAVELQSDQEWTDILVRENGVWLLLGDHGGEGAAEPPTAE